MTRKRCKKLLYAKVTAYHLKGKKPVFGSIGKDYKAIKGMGFASATNKFSYNEVFECLSLVFKE